MRAWRIVGLTTVVLVGVALRVAAARGDLWFDELWTLLLTSVARSPFGVFTRLHSDNNHYLNTLWLMLIGPGASPLLYRLLSIAAAAGTLVLVATWPSRKSRNVPFAAAILVAFSYLLVTYGSEARGYSLAIFFALASYRSIERFLESGRAVWAAVFAGAAILGILSHLTFLFPLAGTLAWVAFEMVRGRRTLRMHPLAGAFFLAPIIALALLWWIDLRLLVIGGGPDYTVAGVLRECVRSMVGAPEGPLELLGVAAIVAALIELVLMARARDGRAIFYLVLVLGPAITLLVERPVYLAPRYFVVVVPFLLLLVASALGRLARLGRWGRPAVVGILLLFVVTDDVAVTRLLTLGRGQYREAIASILAATPQSVVTIGGDHDFRNRLVVLDQARRLGAEAAIAYVPHERWTRDTPEWLLRHDFSTTTTAAPLVMTTTGRRYALVAVYPYAGLSGWSWLVYRAVATPPSDAPR